MERNARALFAGDANIDLQMTGLSSPPRINRETLCAGFAATIGGSTTLCAVAYASLGGDAWLCSLVGDDENGRLLMSKLEGTALHLDMLRSTTETATGVTVNMVHGSTRTQVTYPGTLAVVDETETIISSLDRFSHVHMAGIYPLRAFRPRIGEVLTAAKAAGVTTSVDTQWDESEQWDGLADLLPLLDHLFVNDDEAFSITGKGTVEDAWKWLADRTPCPIVKTGAQGSFAAGKRFAAFPVEVVDSTGAGDSFAAAFLFAKLDRGMGFDESIRFASAAGALCCGYEGGMNPRFTYDGVLGILEPRGAR